jgi:hypothetical protein
MSKCQEVSRADYVASWCLEDQRNSRPAFEREMIVNLSRTRDRELIEAPLPSV